MDVPLTFRFPFEPYSIQLDFMKNVYQCLEQGKLGVFESPTGTGKSLSLICGSLTWLEDHEKNKKRQCEQDLKELGSTKIEDEGEENSSEPSWFTAAKKRAVANRKISELKVELNKIEQKEERIKKLRERAKVVKHSLKSDRGRGRSSDVPKKTFKPMSEEEEKNDDYLLLDDPRSDGESDPETEDCEEMEEETRIIFASRTHSQISQFVREVEKSPFGIQTRVCTLASRQQMCINESVSRLKNSYLINERCLDMQRHGGSSVTAKSETDGRAVKKSKTKLSKCLYLNSKNVQDVRDLSLVEVVDVESLVQLGKTHEACPYYVSRSALSDAQLIVMPYSTLLHRSTREACGIKLKNSIVIIDEAHNLLETISSIHNISISGAIISHAHWQLSQYHAKYSTRLSARNVLNIKQLLFFLSCLLRMLGISNKEGGAQQQQGANQASEAADEKVYDVIDFVVRAGFDHLNLHKLLDFCKQSKLAQKLAGFKAVDNKVAVVEPTRGLKTFLDRLKNHEPPAAAPPSKIEDPTEKVGQEPAEYVTASPLMIIIDFLRSLHNPCQDGRILCVRKPQPSKSFFKYLLLNPASLFTDLIEQPRAVIVAGGTMQPLWEFQYQLFVAAGAKSDRILTFSCGHVIPPEHVLPIALSRGPSNQELDFSWGQRGKLLDELYNLVFNVIQVVPGGVVCFLPSYDFEKQVYEHWKRQGYFAKIETRKKLFREPKKANEVDQVLGEYAQSIRLSNSSRTGALLLCVVGGKLSEGINFSDDLARCVIVVGLPYANSKSAELKEKMDFLNKTTANLRPESETRTPGQLHYESLCFKAVNQSIGRAIRHRNDYAALILADARYSRASAKSSLPNWISQRLTEADKFGPTVATIRKFLLERSKSSGANTV